MCPRNVEKVKDNLYFSDVDINDEVMYTKTHFFGPPCFDYETKINKLLQTSKLITNLNTKGMLNRMEPDILVIFDKLIKKAKDNGIDLESFIIKYFKNHESIDYDIFKNFLTMNFDLQDNETTILLNKITKKLELGNTVFTTNSLNNNNLNTSSSHYTSINLNEVINFFKLMKEITNSQLKLNSGELNQNTNSSQLNTSKSNYKRKMERGKSVFNVFRQIQDSLG